VVDGNLKVGWKVDWALRWYVFGVDYEMYGKDLIDSAVVSAKIVEALGGAAPQGMVYEWFNDENGQSISKTKGNGLTIDEWLTYGPVESLAWYVYQNPQKAKKLHLGLIPTSTDSFLKDRTRFGGEEEAEQVNNPIWFVERLRRAKGQAVGYDSDVTFGLLLNLVNVLNTEDRDLIWDYLLRYDATARETNEELLDAMIDCALNYYRDFVAPTKEFAAPAPEMQPAMDQFVAFLEEYEGNDAQEIQSACYSAGKENGLKLGAWFQTLYRLLLGQQQGPRIGTFVSVYGVQETLELIDKKLTELS
jgi:lysyl-tRNA synthetase class 1